MNVELFILCVNQTWIANISMIEYKWVHKVKRNHNALVGQYNIRLVVEDFLKFEGVDYIDTFSPIIKLRTVCVVLSNAYSYGYSTC